MYKYYNLQVFNTCNTIYKSMLEKIKTGSIKISQKLDPGTNDQ